MGRRRLYGSINNIMESLELYTVLAIYTIACVYFSYQSGAKNGRADIIEDLLDRKLITHMQLMKAYKINEE